ncbi:MAG: bifunctional 4-hydroxy-2-oxoglutarate aldolase/2-dehydro-3-deoxy-phosphogluconate aldolase [Spirochaetes bacterium]|nr:bifunctional 4-hydroxy-2-oxoglutarate aldolase/2-dehydro-3-deoxy-phosphogluconate aldolase [Spirochaetota bacterium]
MIKKEIITRLKEHIIVPVIRLAQASQALRVVEVLHKAGYRVFEITLTMQGAVSLIKKLKKEYRESLIGAGTVLSSDDAMLSIDSGSDFIVSPAFIEDVVDYCQSKKVTIISGAVTPTEILKAFHHGSDMIKIFPASLMGGPKYIRSIKNIYPNIDLMPTGGVDENTALDYLKSGATLLGVGSDMVNQDLVHEKKFAEIEKRAGTLLEKIKNYKLKTFQAFGA